MPTKCSKLWDKLRRKVSDVQSKLPEGAGPSVVNDDFGDVLGVFYGLTGSGHSYRELEDEAKLIKNEILKVKDVAKVEIYGTQTPTIDISVSPSVMARSGITMADIARAFEAQNKVVDAGGIDVGSNRLRIESTGNFYSLDDIRNLTIVSRTGEHFRLADITRIEESYQTPASNLMRINGQPAVGIAISTVPTRKCGRYGSRRQGIAPTDVGQHARRLRTCNPVRPRLRIGSRQPRVLSSTSSYPYLP